MDTSVFRRAPFVLAILVLALLLIPATVTDAGPADQSGSPVLRPVVTELVEPLLVTNAADGSGRLYIVEKGGTIRVLAGGQVPATPYLDLRTQFEKNVPYDELARTILKAMVRENGQRAELRRNIYESKDARGH